MKSNQSGFSVIEIIMAVVIIGLLSAVGWLYWTNTAKNPNTKLGTDKKIDSQPKSSLNNTFTDNNHIYSFEYPKNWTISPNPVVVLNPNPGFDGIRITSPDYDTPGKGKISGEYIDINTFIVPKGVVPATRDEREKPQLTADPNSVYGHFTFAGKPASIWTTSNQSKPPAPTISNMYDGELTNIDVSDRISLSFSGDVGDIGPADKQKLLAVIKTILDSWKWL